MKIYLSTEGTYPFVLGGVSTWVDMLVHGLPHHEFEIGALVDNPHHRVAYRPPPNVTLRPIPLWGLELAEEYLPRPDGWRRAWRTSPPVVRRRFLPWWEHLVDCLAAPEADPGALGDGLSAVAHFAERYDLRRALGDAATWELLLERLRTNPIHARTGLAPAMDFARTLYRYLLPLAAPTPVCDVAHSSAAALCALPAIVAKYRYGTPLVLTEHGIYLRERLLALSGKPFGTKVLFANFYRAVVELAYREADVLTPVCAYNAAWEEELGVAPDRIRVIHNGVDPARIDERPAPGGAPDGGIRRPHRPAQGRRDAHPSVRPGPRRHPRRPAPPVGPDDVAALPAAVPRAVVELGLDDAVHFEGPTNDAASAYGSCHVIGLSSISEAFPYSVVEAMLGARPVVATAVGGVAEALGPCRSRGVSCVVEPGDPGAMAGALVAVLSASAAERASLGASLRDRALTMFTARRMFDDYDDVYQTLAPAAPGSFARSDTSARHDAAPGVALAEAVS